MATTVESLRKAVGKKKNSRAFAWLADLMRQNGDLDAALSCVQAGLSATPCEEGNLVLSKILAEKQDWDGVIEACEFVLCRNPYCLSAIRRLGDAYAEKGDEEKRNRYYRLLHDLDPLDAFWKEEYAPKIEMAEEIPELEDSPEMAPPVVAEPQAEALEQDAPVASVEEQTDEEKSEEKDEDPFSSLATLLPADEDGDSEVSFRDLENSLDNAIADFSPANGEKDEFPTDEIDGNDISVALSGIFGSAETDGPLPEQGEKADESSSEEKIEDKPQSLSDAFDSLFGEDELPDEFVLSNPSNHVPASDSTQSSKTSEDSAPSEASPSESSSLFTKSIETSPSAVGLEKSVESSFDSLFGEETDDLPLESLGETSNPAADSASRVEPSIEVSPVPEKEDSTSEPSPLFEKSAEEPPQPESTLEKSVESSFDSLFGEESDDLPLESLGETSKPAADSASRVEPSIEVSPVPEKEDSTSEPLASEPSPLFEKSAEEPSKPESTLEKSVESSFDSLFGEETDDLPLESLGEASKPAADSASRVEPSIEVSPVPEKEDSPSEPLASEPSPLFEKSAEEPSKPESTLEKSVESSFDSLFGEESDDLPLESLGEASKPAADSASRVEPSIEVSPVPEKEDSPSEPLASEPSPLFEKSAEEPSKPESTLEKSVESSFDSLFGEESDDALAEDSTTSTRTLAEIYFEQGVYDEAIKIYKDLLRKNPENVALKDRLLEIEKTRDDRQKEN